MRILISTGGGDPANYVQAVAQAGGQPCPAYLPPGGPAGWAGLILAGGGDLDPALMGQQNRGSRGIDRARDRAELALLDAFLGSGRPVLAICRGHQLANVWAGGDLIQDLGSALVPFHQEEQDVMHPVRAKPDSLMEGLYGNRFPVNSNHHQGVGRVGAGLDVTAWSEADVVEAMEHVCLPLICVQFHPERLTGAWARPDGVDGGALFRHFLRRCGGG